MDDPLAADILDQDVPRAHAAFFPIKPDADLHFELGRVCMGLSDYVTARELFTQSNATAGEHHVTWHNIGLCWWFLQDDQAAVEAFTASLNLKPTYGEASKWLDKASARLTAGTDAQDVEVQA